MGKRESEEMNGVIVVLSIEGNSRVESSVILPFLYLTPKEMAC